MQKKNSEEILEKMIDLLLMYIEELLEYKNVAGQEFQYGERTAYTECLEMIQEWKYAEINGLDFNIEKEYPLWIKWL